MKALADIRSFPKSHRETLQRKFGVSSAEAFFEHAVHNAEGVRQALDVPKEEFDKLLALVEGYLTPSFIERCRKPPKKRSRGVIVD